MKKVLLYIFVFFFTLSSYLSAQTERETRAVWVATNFKLDWPPATYNAEEQKKELIKIFDDIKRKKFNTIYFQVRSNGTVFFESSYEPFTPYLTGEVDVKPNYDPLKFAIEQAHKRGIEIHAWVNVVRCFTGQELSILNHPFHIKQRRPDWVIEDKRNGSTSYWLDMGLPEVRHYLVSLFSELVRKYNIDGLHLDFIRYPGKEFNDAFSYNLYGEDKNIDQWRRDNINTFIKDLSANVKSVNSYLKLGAAPVGIYKNNHIANGFEGFGEVYQDSRLWLEEGWVDYLAPQIYWPLEGPPRFDKLAEEWSNNSFNRSIVLGIAAYKPEVNKQVDKLIEFSRKTNADGFAFFRYGNIKNNYFYSLNNIALPAEMAWLDSSPPQAPSNLLFSYDNSDNMIITLNWTNPRTDSISYYALYSLPSPESELKNEYLFEIIPSDRTSVKLAIDRPKRINYYFTLKSLNKLWNESINSSNIVEVTFRELSVLAEINDVFSSPILIKDKTNLPKLLVYVDNGETIEISNAGNTLTESHQLLPGKNILAISKELINSNSITITYQKSGEVKTLRIM